MKKSLALFVALAPWLLNAQFVFKGQVSQPYANSEVCLSFVDDYRKTSRIYLDQIIAKSTTDSLGHFSFQGNQLPQENGMYRIHVDKCADQSTTNHFLRECAESLSLLFIANNRDTLDLPLTRQNQPFCSIISTNRASEYLLEVEALKEEMIFDFLDIEGTTGRMLHLKKWFSALQTFAEQTQEPMVEIYVHDFLSDRSNETHDFYLDDLASNPYYLELADRLRQKYPEGPLTKQYQNELQADRNLVGLAKPEETHGNALLFYGLGLVALLILGLLFWKGYRSTKRKSHFKNLSAQEMKIAASILAGKSNKEIANELFISLSTVKTHVNSIYKKLGVTSRAEIKSRFKA